MQHERVHLHAVTHEALGEIGAVLPADAGDEGASGHQPALTAAMSLSTITLAEVWQGWFNLDETHPDHTELRRFADNLPHAYRVLKFDEAAARKWGEITCEGHDPLPVRDSLIAAIALSRGYRVVSRDTAPFLRAGCKVVNPWR